MRPWCQICLLPSWPLTSHQGHTELINVRQKNAGKLLNEWTVAERKEQLGDSWLLAFLPSVYEATCKTLRRGCDPLISPYSAPFPVFGWAHPAPSVGENNREHRGGSSWLTAGWAEPRLKRLPLTLTRHEESHRCHFIQVKRQNTSYRLFLHHLILTE